jgi:hypothetical protein
MVEIYTHTLTGDSAEDILMLYGVNLRGGKKKRNERLQQEMVGPHCPFCHSINVPGTQLCTSCHRPISAVSYDTITREAENTKKEIEAIKKEFVSVKENLANINSLSETMRYLLKERREIEKSLGIKLPSSSSSSVDDSL